MNKFLLLLDKYFARASMLSKFSLIFNIALSYVVGTLYKQIEVLNAEVVKVHVTRYEDLNNLMIRLNYLKHQVNGDVTTPDIHKEIDNIALEQRQSVNPKVK